MEFIALPVSKGDSFILKDDKYNYVVDGGFNESGITAMVKEEIGEQDIEILICTHYDEDHLNGVIGLIKSTIDINEIWLPSIFAGAEGYLDEYSALFDNYESEYEDENDEELLSEIEDFKEEDGISVSTNKRKKTYRMRANLRKVYTKILPRIKKLLEACRQRKGKSTIRWFKYNHWHKEYKVHNYPLIGLNCEEVKVIRPYKSLGALILDLTLINRMGLVFKYERKKFPNVLFCSDSNFVFTGRRKSNKVYLKEKSIVTAPHHGAEENKNVYKKVIGKSLIYVRSDEQTTLRPCKAYKRLRLKYCTICNSSSTHRKVKIKYRSGAWFTMNRPCRC
ncbi:MBL fold metallo-hydrolase [Priestia sp. P5]|uniref:MBL fold metallo-hydrolase n=1 Tax=Priestia sp. P5 TaxID=2917806 RepID=UPI00064A17F5|nr:MBL fold metallo-hydrolase [Priestia sp. P5]MDG0059014.1 MBL fold metallo-hydrolase [Priestia sp. P5]